MADTGAPWNLPYPLPTDLVRDGAQAIQDLAEATADGLDAAGGLVAVKHVLKTNTFTSGSVAAGGSVAVPDLEITHEVTDAANRLIITAFFGAAGSTQRQGNVGIRVAEGATLIGVGGADGSRPRVGAGGITSEAQGGYNVAMPSITFVHTPGAGSKTYTVNAVNMHNGAVTLYINRSEFNTNDGRSPLSASALVIQEVKV